MHFSCTHIKQDFMTAALHAIKLAEQPWMGARKFVNFHLGVARLCISYCVDLHMHFAVEQLLKYMYTVVVFFSVRINLFIQRHFFCPLCRCRLNI